MDRRKYSNENVCGNYRLEELRHQLSDSLGGGGSGGLEIPGAHLLGQLCRPGQAV